MKKIHYLVSTDWHLKSGNIPLVTSLIEDQCKLAISYGLSEIVCLGDVFDSRVSQRVDVLYGFLQILETCKQYKIKLICIPGNHDKTSYADIVSFLHPFKNHPNLRLIDTYAHVLKDDVNYHFVPFFDEAKSYVNYLDLVEYKGKDVLFSHVAVTGSVNNDGSVVSNTLTTGLFDSFSKVYLGHYHNTQEVTNKIVHLPSIRQTNFGENDNKGYCCIYDDFSYDIVNSTFKKYIKIKFDMSLVTIKDIDYDVSMLNSQSAFYLLIFKGKESQLKALDVGKYKDAGFQVKLTNEETKIADDEDVIANLYNHSNIVDIFQEFCSTYHYEFKDGVKYLNSVINEVK